MSRHQGVYAGERGTKGKFSQKFFKNQKGEPRYTFLENLSKSWRCAIPSNIIKRKLKRRVRKNLLKVILCYK